VSNLADLIADLGDQIEEIDINPRIVGPEGTGAVVVDALVILRWTQP